MSSIASARFKIQALILLRKSTLCSYSEEISWKKISRVRSEKSYTKSSRQSILSRSLEIIIEGGAGPTVQLAIKLREHFATVVQLSMLTWVHEKVSLAAALSDAMTRRQQEAPPDASLPRDRPNGLYSRERGHDYSRTLDALSPWPHRVGETVKFRDGDPQVIVDMDDKYMPRICLMDATHEIILTIGTTVAEAPIHSDMKLAAKGYRTRALKGNTNAKIPHLASALCWCISQRLAIAESEMAEKSPILNDN